MLYKFNKNQILTNRLKTYPEVQFDIHNSNIYLNNRSQLSGVFSNNLLCVPSGYVSLYELNVDRLSGSNNFIYPYIEKNGSLDSFKTISLDSFNSDFLYGDVITGSYPLSSSLHREFYFENEGTTGYSSTYRPRIESLRNTLNYYSNFSLHYAYSSSYGDKSKQKLNLISIPSIFYGSNINKGSVKLEYYVTGTLVGTLEDSKKNGELIQTGPSGSNGSGSVAGIVLYNEGFIILTGSWNLSEADTYMGGIDLYSGSWVYFGSGIQGTDSIATSLTKPNFKLVFDGVNYIPNITLFAHAPKGDLNFSKNPTFIQYEDQNLIVTSSNGFREITDLKIKNTVSSSFKNYSEQFNKQVFISKVGIYDENKNLIGIAKLAKPVKKTEERDLTFKLKIDL
jgi:hypothetical protein